MSLATVMQSYTQMGGARPFGCSLLVIGKDDLSGPMLYQCDPSGCYFPWKATALGKNYHNARSFLERRYNEELELDLGCDKVDVGQGKNGVNELEEALLAVSP